MPKSPEFAAGSRTEWWQRGITPEKTCSKIRRKPECSSRCANTALSLLNNLPLHSFKGICVFYCSRSFLCRLFTSPTLVVSVAPTVLQPQNHATKIANNSDFKLVKSCQTKVGKAREAAFCCDFINLRSPWRRAALA